MRLVFMFLLFVIACLFVVGIVYTTVKSINNRFLEKEVKQAPNLKKDKHKNSFEVFVENYIKMKSTSSENVRILQFIARDIIKSQDYHKECIKFNIATIVYLFLILSVALLSSFIASLTLNQDYYFANLIIGAVVLFLLVMVGQRMKHKKFKVFESIPLTSNQAEKLKNLDVQGSTKEYIMEKSSKNHGLNGADLIFLLNLV
jgi:ABC-type sugar transport system permease subunit